METKKNTQIPAEKAYDDLTFTDDFLFGKVLYNNLELCRRMLEIILGKPIKKVCSAVTQKTIKLTNKAKGVRFDVYTEDSEGTVYDVEMQVVRKANLPKRSRYYHGMIDLNLIESGDDYNKLKKSYVIFICKEGIRDGMGNAFYSFQNRCDQDASIRLEDEAYTVFLNARGNKEGLSNDLGAFLQYVETDIPSDNQFVQDICKDVKKAHEHEEWRIEYMTLLERDKENREIGRIEGLIEGRKEGLIEGQKKGRKEGNLEGKIEVYFTDMQLSIPAIAQKMGIGEGYVKEVLEGKGLLDA